MGPPSHSHLASAGEEQQAEADLQHKPAESKCELLPRERAAERPVYVSGDSYRTENISKNAILEFLGQSP